MSPKAVIPPCTAATAKAAATHLPPGNSPLESAPSFSKENPWLNSLFVSTSRGVFRLMDAAGPLLHNAAPPPADGTAVSQLPLTYFAGYF